MSIDQGLTWQEKVRLKRDAQADAITAFETDDTDPRSQSPASASDSVTEIDDVATLVQRIASRTLTAEEVTRAYIRNLTEILFEDALRQARELDAYQRQHGETLGPLHGVPMTLKDQFNVKGHDTTLGYTYRCFNPDLEDATLVAMLKRLGAVIVAKTNLPQSIMWCETENPLWGLTTNPMNPEYTPGGSSGGESAVLSLHGSLLGWGTDIGGSIRIPSHMMSLYGLRPSSARLPYWRVAVSTEGQQHVPSVVGPMARSLSSLTLAMRAVISLRPWELDERCDPIPWREDIYQEYREKPLTIGLLVDDGHVRPHPPITRVLLSVAEKLRQAGHEIMQWDATYHEECIALMDKYYMADGGQEVRGCVQLGGESFIPHVEKLVNRGGPISVLDYWSLNTQKVALQHGYLNKWNSTKSQTTGRPVDILLMPVMPHTAVPHMKCRWVGYTKVWNLLDYSALAVPAGQVEEQDIGAEWNYQLRNEDDAWNAEIWKKHGQDMAEMGLPVGVQIVGKRLEEEKVLAVGAVIDGLLRTKDA